MNHSGIKISPGQIHLIQESRIYLPISKYCIGFMSHLPIDQLQGGTKDLKLSDSLYMRQLSS